MAPRCHSNHRKNIEKVGFTPAEKISSCIHSITTIFSGHVLMTINYKVSEGIFHILISRSPPLVQI